MKNKGKILNFNFMIELKKKVPISLSFVRI